jgi:DNA helicase-4
MTGFGGVFPHSQTVSLTRTFRCDQDICDLSSRFIMRNPNQQKKTVLGQSRGFSPHIQVHFIDEMNQELPTASIRREEIKEIIRNHRANRPNGTLSVFILGRYRFELDGLQDPNFGPGIEVKVMTIHASKGLEADLVIVVGMNSGTKYGFPSRINDDPLLGLVMPLQDSFPHSEERRLFYVASTRAKESLHLLSSQHNPSEFVLEAQRDFVDIVQISGLSDNGINQCPRCQGMLVKRTARLTGKEFFGCQNFPRCDFTKNIEP